LSNDGKASQVAALFLLLFAVFLGLSGDVSQVDFGRRGVLVGIVGIRGKVIVFITLTFSKNEGSGRFLKEGILFAICLLR
jgi:hypothetical protein